MAMHLASDEEEPTAFLNLVEQEASDDDDTTADQAARGADIQGIPWERMPWTRAHYRSERLQAYANFVNCPDVPHDALEQECGPVSPTAQLLDFRYNARAPRSSVAHFQLRNLVWATSRADVYLSSDGALCHWDALRRTTRRALDLDRGGHGLGRVQVSTMAAHAGAGLLAAGGFNGELIVAPLRCRDEAAPPAPPTPPAHAAPPWRAGAAPGAPPGLLHAARIASDEDGITNAIELLASGPGGGGPALVASNNDAHVRLFDAGGMRLAASFRFPWAVNCSAVSPCGSLAAVVGDHPTGALLDLRSGCHVASLAGHLDYSFAAAWHPGGTLLATGSQDTTARLWDVRQPRHALHVLKGRMSAVRSLRFAPGGQTLALAEAADFVHVLPCGGAAPFARSQVIDLFGEVAGISYSPDGDAFFVGVADMTYGSLLEFAPAQPRRAQYLVL